MVHVAQETAAQDGAQDAPQFLKSDNLIVPAMVLDEQPLLHDFRHEPAKKYEAK